MSVTGTSERKYKLHEDISGIIADIRKDKKTHTKEELYEKYGAFRELFITLFELVVLTEETKESNDILNMMISFSTLDNIKIEEDKNLMRPNDTSYMVGDNSKSFDELGWKNQISLKETLRDLLNYYRSIV